MKGAVNVKGNIIYFKPTLTEEDFNLIEGSLLMSKETLGSLPLKTKEIKSKIKEIDTLLEKF